jgi:hypothetical protein
VDKYYLIQFSFLNRTRNYSKTIYFYKYKYVGKFEQYIVIDSNLFDLQLKLILPDPDFVFQRLLSSLLVFFLLNFRIFWAAPRRSTGLSFIPPSKKG